MSPPHLSDSKHSTSISKVIGSTPVGRPLIFFFFFCYWHYYVSTTTSHVKTLVKWLGKRDLQWSLSFSVQPAPRGQGPKSHWEDVQTLSHLRLITLIHSLNAIQVVFFQILIFHFVVGITGPVVIRVMFSRAWAGKDIGLTPAGKTQIIIWKLLAFAAP